MKKFLFLLSLLFTFFANAQDLITQDYTTLKPTHTLTFQSIADNTKIWGLGLGEGVNIIYDKLWNELERHEAGQEEIININISVSRSFEYDNIEKIYVPADWTTYEWDYSSSKYGYSLSLINDYSDFIQGKTNGLYMVRTVSEPFLENHSVYLFSENLQGIAGLPNNIHSTYTTLITHFEIVDWDGNILTTIEPPYYIRYGSCQGIEVEDKSYLIVTGNEIYPKTVIKECPLFSTDEYELSSCKVEPEYYHYFIYEYDKPTGNTNLIKSESVKATRRIVGVYDLKGNRLNAEQSGINILLYSDGTSCKVILP